MAKLAQNKLIKTRWLPYEKNGWELHHPMLFYTPFSKSTSAACLHLYATN
jgi:hypothetical protein